MPLVFWVLFIVACAFQLPVFEPHAQYRGYFWLVMLGILGWVAFGGIHA
jgi:hypothetical protein